MNGEGVRYPAFLLGGSHSRPTAFRGPGALFVSGRFRPPLGPMDEDTLVDSSGRSWTLRAVSAIGRWGTWKERFYLWWRRQYLVEFDATEGPAISVDELKAHVLQRADASEAALKADAEVSEDVRQYFLERWAEARKELAAAGTFEAVADAMGPSSLYADSWFNGHGRSNRLEYLVVVFAAFLIMIAAGLVAFLMHSSIGYLINFALGTVLPYWLIGAAAARRVHDFGWPFYAFVILFLVFGGVELGGYRYLQNDIVTYLELGIAGWAMFILAWAIPPGTPGENRYDPQPNPGPSL